ncbi:hypothetical protein AWH63_10810 [Marinobacter sp. C18]|uniref:hypothetical protein n=1 Tax=Marinobacter sp. C18 TaxID=1772288 RepID=UPI0009672632|nr:hypothetical protein [Marinobacter sp. C18]OLF82021.1 hypothetical protein AWH63_10810 [Marinobacter sp. C18]
MNMTPIAFVTSDVAVVPTSASSELANMIGRPVTVAEFAKANGNQPVSVYESDAGELLFETHPKYDLNGGVVFIQGDWADAAAA